MNNHKINIDEYTRKLVQISGVKQPAPDFTKGVMGQILKSPEVSVSFVTKDDKKTNVWLFIAVGSMLIGYIAYFFIKNGFGTGSGFSGLKMPEFVNAFVAFFSELFNELSFSPFILLALLGIIILVIMDKTIVKYLYSL